MQTSKILGAGWHVSMNGTVSWQTINLSMTSNTLVLGGFNRNGYLDDVLQASGDPNVGWRISMG